MTICMYLKKSMFAALAHESAGFDEGLGGDLMTFVDSKFKSDLERNLEARLPVLPTFS